MNIQKVTAGIVFFLFAMFTFQAQAGVTLKLGVQESSSGSAMIPLIISADEAVSILGGVAFIELNDSIFTISNTVKDTNQSLPSSWSVSSQVGFVGEMSEGDQSPANVMEEALGIYFGSDTEKLNLVAGEEVTIAQLAVNLSGATAFKKAELFLHHQSRVEFDGAVDHVFVNFDDGAVKVTSWDSVWQNASDTALQVSDLAGKLFFQIKTNDDGSKYARKWLFKNVDNVKDGWIKEFRGKNPTTGVAVVVVKHFNWSVDTSGRLNLVGNGIETGTDWGRTFAKLPGATAHQLPLYGGETSIDGTATPLLFEINRDFTVSVTDSMPYMLELENEDKGPEYSEVVLLEQ
ncbi:MAG: hypothetical protein HOC52_05980, partial [Thiotrichales bacterium]|nr:hypothetical protein [Thiotrichales bacterium]